MDREWRARESEVEHAIGGCYGAATITERVLGFWERGLHGKGRHELGVVRVHDGAKVFDGG